MKRLMLVCLVLLLALFSGCGREINETSSYVIGLPSDPIEKLEWPEKYKDEIRAVICVKKVTDQIEY